MDLIKLSNKAGDAVSELGQGEQINGWEKCLWVERWQKPGEFKIEAPLSSGLREFLPLETFITHLETLDLMWVENHEIKQPKDKDPTIEISGRSFTSYLENRIIGENLAAVSNDKQDYILSDTTTAQQVYYLIFDNLIGATEANNQLPGFYVADITTGTLTEESRLAKYGTVWDRVYEILKIDDLGLKMRRPLPTDELSYFLIYTGTDRTNEILFTWTGGDLESLEYFFSTRKLKTSARVISKWLQVRVGLTETKFDRRVMLVDASDLDDKLNAMPTGTPLTDLISAMTIRGQEALSNQNRLTITEVDSSPNSRWRYRTDYNIGDLVTVHGDFGESAPMRVVEFAEVSDENGTSGHPTLAIPGED